MNDMLRLSQSKVAQVISDGTGANVAFRNDKVSPYRGLKVWFSDLEEERGPIALLDLAGSRYRLRITMGKFSKSLLKEMNAANEASVSIALKYFEFAKRYSSVSVSPKSASSLKNFTSTFKITAKHDIDTSLLTIEEGIICSTENVTVPLLVAMAELIGFKRVLESDQEGEDEGALTEAIVKRRERSLRNRVMCFAIHGYECSVCMVKPRSTYNFVGDILEVHHLEPLAAQSKPRKFDPREDLVPLCPNCHRAIHRRNPPYTPKELREIMGINSD